MRRLPLAVLCVLGLAAPASLAAPSVPFPALAPPGGAHAAPGPLLAVGRRPPKKRKDVGTLYREALALYDKGQFPAAATAFGRILQRYPGHEPSRVQLAKTLYRLERVKDAYALFKQLDPQYLDAETNYEYAQSFFQQNDFEKSLAAFKRVPKDHPLHDLACYYGAIAAFRLKRYQDAGDLIDEAVVLPNRLIKSRNLYKKNIAELRDREQEEALAREKAQEIQRMRAETKAYGDTLEKERKDKDKEKSEKAEAKAAAAAEALTYHGFQELGTEARAGGSVKSLAVARHGHDEDVLVNRAFFHFITTPHARFGKAQTLPGAVGARLDLRLEDRFHEGFEESIRPDADEEATALLYRHERGNDKFGKGRFALWVEAPVGALLAGAEASYFGAIRDFKTKDSVNNVAAEVFLGGSGKNGHWRARGSFTQTSVEKRHVRQVGRQSLEGEWRFRDAVGLYGDLGASQYAYQDDSLPGPDAKAEATVGAKAFFPYRVTLGAEAGFTLEKDYRVAVGEDAANVVFDGETVRSRVWVEAKPVNWLGLNAEAARAERHVTRFAAASEEAVASAKETQYNLLSALSVSAYVNLLF